MQPSGGSSLTWPRTCDYPLRDLLDGGSQLGSDRSLQSVSSGLHGVEAARFDQVLLAAGVEAGEGDGDAAVVGEPRRADPLRAPA
jgi:hypothetical protein